MRAICNPFRVGLLLLCGVAASAQVAVPVPGAGAAASGSADTAASKPVHRKPRLKAFQAPYNPDVVVLDAAHGGDDEGAKLGGAGSEKDFNLAFADRLRTLLTTNGFSVVMTRTPELETVSGDQRAELANRSRAVACLLLHATNAGSGVHLFTSALTASSAGEENRVDGPIVQWDSAQARSVNASMQLGTQLSTAMNGLKVPLMMGRVSVSPIDSMTCPAVGLELAPAKAGGRLDDEGYEQRVAEALVAGLNVWRQHAREQIAAAEAAAQTAAGANGSSPAAAQPKPKPKPKPILVKPPDEQPLAPDAGETRQKPAPIERQPPAGGGL